MSGGSNIITRVLKSSRGQWERKVREKDMIIEQPQKVATLLVLKMEKRQPQGKKHGQATEAGKGKEIDFPLKTPERNTALMTP